MLSDLATTTTNNLLDSRAVANDFTRSTSVLATTAIEKIAAKTSTTVHNSAAMTKQLDATNNKFKEHYCQNITEAGMSNTGAKQSVETVTATIANKRSALDSTVATVVQDVDAAIHQSCGVVDQTATAAETVLTNVNNATNRMTDSTSTSLQQFTAYLDREGQQLSSSLVQHFQHLSTHLDTQQQELTTANSHTRTHGESVENRVLRPFGDTPSKSKYRKTLPPELVKTRSHDDIRSDVRRTLEKQYHDGLSGSNGSNGVIGH